MRHARFHAGADAVLAKPVSATRLYDCIISIYESPRTFVDNGVYFGPDRRLKDRPFEGEDRRSANEHDFELELVDAAGGDTAG